MGSCQGPTHQRHKHAPTHTCKETRDMPFQQAGSDSSLNQREPEFRHRKSNMAQRLGCRKLGVLRSNTPPPPISRKRNREEEKKQGSQLEHRLVCLC